VEWVCIITPHSSTTLLSDSLVADKIVEVGEPVHVEALVLVERHALNEGTKVLVDAETLKVLGESGLDPLIKGGKIGTGILLDLAFKTVELLYLGDIGADLHAVVVDLSVDGGALDDEATLTIGISHENGEVAVVLGFGTTLFIIVTVLVIGKLLVVRDRLSGLEGDLDDLVANLLLQAHEDAIRLLVEAEAGLL